MHASSPIAQLVKTDSPVVAYAGDTYIAAEPLATALAGLSETLAARLDESQPIAATLRLVAEHFGLAPDAVVAAALA